MPPKRKAATNHSTIPPRSRTTVTTEVVNAGENQFLPVQPGIQRPATEETPGRLIPESEVEAIVQRAVKQGVETACRQFFPHLNDMTAVMPATSRPPSSQDGATASTALPQVNEAVGEETVVHSALNVAATVSQVSPVDDTDANPFTSTAIPLPALVTQVVKEKIWAGEYIDMSLIDKKDNASYEQVIKYQSGAPVVQWVPKHKPKTLSIDQWTNNFHIFASIYCERKPKEFAALLKYASLVRKLATKGADWQYYDSSFRRLQAANGEQGWDRVEWELWHEAIMRRLGQPSQSTKQSGPHPKGFCFKFLNDRSCPGPNSGCKHFHGCTTCQGSHHPSNCPTLSHAPRSHFGSMQNFRPPRQQYQQYSSNRFQPYTPRAQGFPRHRHPYNRR
ncbi:uncharacterized protein LOC117340901 [Pecten maximus]|uniref:uncharacterized protein LOC117340901 n=1 Tax=Pecten maximus TaxID=6579 RepID=UPI001458ECB9|nr:uncharacterized protein LOC117340901 [Pecten maximus]